MTAYIVATRALVPDTLLAVGAEMSAGILVYALVFLLFGISARERHLYLSQASVLILHRAARARETDVPVTYRCLFFRAGPRIKRVWAHPLNLYGRYGVVRAGVVEKR